MMKMAEDYLMILAILLAPLIAIQVQKIIERYREDRARKLDVFKTLMATRAATVSPQHVQALNMIDIEFEDKKYKNVTDAWKTYLDHLNHYPREDVKQQPMWSDRRVDLLTKLLFEMGKSLGYTFDEAHVRRAINAPEAHAQNEHEALLIRRGLIGLLSGNTHLKMDVTSLPVSEEIIAELKILRVGTQELIDGKRKLGVFISSETDSKQKDR